MSSLAVDPAGVAHIAYQDSMSYDLRYANHGPSGWELNTLYTTGDVGWSPCIALDSSGRLYIGYADTTKGVVKVAHQGTYPWVWDLEVVAPLDIAHLSLAVDGQDRPHVVYRGPSGLEYAFRDESGWITEMLGTEGADGQFPQLALDGSGRPYVLYFDQESADNIYLRLAYRDEDTWQFLSVERVMGIVGGIDIALDGSGVPHFVYRRSGPGAAPPYELVYGYREGGGWHLEVVDDEAGTASLALDADGRPHIVSCSLYAYQDAKGWHYDTLPGPGVARSLALDGAGNPHVTLSDSYTLHYATLVPKQQYLVYLPLVIGQ